VDGPRFQVSRGAAVTWLRTLPAASVDLVITEPPYDSLGTPRAIATPPRPKHSHASSNDWFEIFPNARFGELFAEIHRVMRRDAHFYLFCDAETMFVAKPLAEQAGFKFWKPLIWEKRTIGMGYHYRAKYECILFFEKGKRKLADLGVADVLSFPRVHNGYPTEKPFELSEVLVTQSSSPGELVIDPFMGSGSVGVAAIRQGRTFAGNDLGQEAVDITRERLRAVGGLDGLRDNYCPRRGPRGGANGTFANPVGATGPRSTPACPPMAPLAPRRVRERGRDRRRGCPAVAPPRRTSVVPPA